MTGSPVTGPLTLGTAGHIDHGKTALIRALTGVDTDRLPQERERGISIELGYAALTLPDERRLSIVDVPGHERFVRTMVAGATGIDMFLMVVAADDGVMPQTREHAAVLRALGLARGVVAITKSDLADPGPATAAARELLPGAETVAVSSRTGAGLDGLRAALARLAAATPSRGSAPGPLRLPIDRVFSIRGAGTVVTGTLWAGSVTRGAEIVLLPQGRRVRVRGVQVHDQAVPAAAAGQRVAVNLRGVGVEELGRGDVLADPAAANAATFRLDCATELDPGQTLYRGERVQVHHGTREAPARVTPLGEGLLQLRLEAPLIALAGDRAVVRRIAPPDTLGGVRILDAHPARHAESESVVRRLRSLAAGTAPEPDSAAGEAAERDSREHVPLGGSAAADGAPGPLSASAQELERRLRAARFEPPSDAELDADDLAALREAGAAVRVARTQHFHREVLEAAEQRIVELARENGGAVRLGEVRDALATSRRCAQALLEHLDSERVLIRRGEVHVLRRRAAREPES